LNGFDILRQRTRLLIIITCDFESGLQTIKGVLQANDDDGMTVNNFHSLPPFEKFAAGMPEMVLEEQPVQTRRLEKVLKAIKDRRNELS